jgi:biopolymer transport protein ExbD
MRRRQTLARPEIITRVNVTPIIDVALVLVIILLVTAPIITATDMRIQLPEAHTRAAEDQRNISVTLGAEGEITVDKDRVSQRDLARAVKARLATPGRDKDLVVVCADQGVAYATIEAILTDVRRAGAQRIAIATRQKQGGRR